MGERNLEKRRANEPRTPASKGVLRSGRNALNQLIVVAVALMMAGVMLSAFFRGLILPVLSGFTLALSPMAVALLGACAVALWWLTRSNRLVHYRRAVAIGLALGMSVFFVTSTPWPSGLLSLSRAMYAAMGVPQARADRALHQTFARDVVSRRRLRKTLTVLRKQVRERPQNVDMRADLAVLLERMGSYAKATKQWRRIYRALPRKHRNEAYGLIYMRALMRTETPLQKMMWRASVQYLIRRAQRAHPISILRFGDYVLDSIRSVAFLQGDAQRSMLGIGTKADPRRAVSLYSKLAQSGFVSAMHRLLWIQTHDHVLGPFSVTAIKKAMRRNESLAMRRYRHMPAGAVSPFWAKFAG